MRAPNKKKHSIFPKIAIHSFSARLVVAGLLFFVCIDAVSGKFFAVQIHNYEYWKQKAFAQQSQISNVEPERGDIFVRDKDGGLHAVAVNKRFFDIGVDPRKTKADPSQDAHDLASLLSLAYPDVFGKMKRSADPYEPLAKHVDESLARAVQERDIDGVVMQEQDARYYPLGNFASQVVGFVGYDQSGSLAGRYGIELGMDDTLRGSGPSADDLQKLMDQGSFLAAKNLYVQNGANVVLTIDPNIQSEVEKDLADEVKQWKAKSGNAIVMDPRTGAIRAMANYPSFDPNQYAKTKDMSVFLNSCVSLRYEPGSIFKPLTMAAGLTSGKITPDSQYYDDGAKKIGNVTIHNAGNSAPHKLISMALFLERSYNLGAVFIEQTVGNQFFHDFLLKTLKLEDKTNIDLPQEIQSSFANLRSKNANDVNYAESAFGQGIAMTPIKLIQMIGSLANNGVVMQPYVIDTVQYPDGTQKATAPHIVGQEISQDVVRQEVPLLEGVVEAERGSAHLARVPGYRIAGKTGTADIASSDGSGYSGEVNHSFVGFGPISDPKFVVLTRIEQPQGIRYAEATAVPLGGKIMKYIVEYYGIPPDAPSPSSTP